MLAARTFLLFLVATFGVACGAREPVVPVAKPLEQLPPPPAFDEIGLRQLDFGMKGLVNGGEVANAAYVLSKDGAIVAQNFHGTLSPEITTTVTGATPYRIETLTKPVTATGLLMLYDDGKFSLDDPVTKFLPELSALKVAIAGGKPVPVSRAPVMRELLLHTAGFANRHGPPNSAETHMLAKQFASAASSTEFVERAAMVPLVFEPGADWSDSIASDLQGVIIERITGQSLGTFLKSRLFDPLGMTSTSFDLAPDKHAQMPPITANDGAVLRVLNSGVPYAVGEVSFHRGGDGLVSTLDDVRKFADLLANGGSIGGKVFLKPETFKLMSSNGVALSVIEPGVPGKRLPYGAGYGLGVGIVQDVRALGGLAPNGSLYASDRLGPWFWADPANKISFAGLVQTQTPLKDDPFKLSSLLVYRAMTLDAVLAQPPGEPVQ